MYGALGGWKVLLMKPQIQLFFNGFNVELLAPWSYCARSLQWMNLKKICQSFHSALEIFECKICQPGMRSNSESKKSVFGVNLSKSMTTSSFSFKTSIVDTLRAPNFLLCERILEQNSTRGRFGRFARITLPVKQNHENYFLWSYPFSKKLPKWTVCEEKNWLPKNS